MCVAIAKKVKDKITGEEKYNLFKIRDREFNPNYIIRSYTYKNGLTTLFLIDDEIRWTEGINSNGIMIVSSSLDDLENNLEKAITGEADKEERMKFILKKINERNGLIIRRALRQLDLKSALDVLVEAKFIGNTFISDGDKCYLIECAITHDTFNKYIEEISDEEDEEADFVKFRMEMMRPINQDKIDIKVKEITSDLEVRTNHALLLKNVGYVEGEKGYNSSVARREAVIKALKDFDGNTEEIVRLIARLGADEIDENPENRPIRRKDRLELPNKLKQEFEISNYYSTDIVGLNPNGTMYIYPMHSTIRNLDMAKLLDKKGVHLIVIKPEDIYENLFKKAIQRVLNKNS